MAAGAGSQQSLRKAMKTVGLAKANGDFKVLDIAISKATKHGDALPKEKHVITILHAIPASRPRAEVAYCIHALAKRLSKAHSWKVALKTVIVIHRALREVDDTFCDALIKYSWSKGHILNISHSWDETSPSAWGYSTWVRLYASYLEERLECFRVLKYDVQKDHLRTKELETSDLLRQLPALQQLLSRLLDCQPEVGTICNGLIQYAISMVAGESAKLYAAITDGIVILVDKFFEMQRDDAVRALEIYKKSVSQAERLSEFFGICRSLNFGRGLKMFKIQQPPQSFLTTMEDYVKEASGFVMLQLPPPEAQTDAPKEAVVVEGDLLIDHDDDVEEKSAPEHPSAATATKQIVDLLSFDEVIPVISESDENNSLALAIVPAENPSESRTDGLNSTNSSASWEIELFTPQTSNGAANQQTPSTSNVQTMLMQAGKLDRSTLDSLYDNAMASTPNQKNMLCSPAALAPSNPFVDIPSTSYQFQEPYHASSDATPENLQMKIMAQQQQYFMMMQQQQMQQLQLPSTVPNPPSPGQNQLSLYQNLPSPSHNPPSPFKNLPNPFQSSPSPGQILPSLYQDLQSPGYNPSSPFQNLPNSFQNPPSSLTSSGNPFSEQISNPPPPNSDNGLI